MEGALMPPPSVFGAHAESQTVPVSNLEHLLGVSQPDQASMLQSGFSSALAPGQGGTSDLRSSASGDKAAGQLDGAGEASIGSVSWLTACKGCQDCLHEASCVRPGWHPEMPRAYYMICCAIVKAAVPVVCANPEGCL